MSQNKTIFGILIKERAKDAKQVQSVLSKYGCNIKTRIGLHDATDNICSPSGMILLEMVGKEADINNLEKELLQLTDIEFRKMNF